MREVQLASLTELAAPVRGMRVLLWGFSGSGFPGGDGAEEAAEVLPRAGVHAVRSHELDPARNDKLAQKYDVTIVCNTRVGDLLKSDKRIWRNAVYWFWDLRPAGVAAPLRGRVKHVFLTYRGRWVAPTGEACDPAQWPSVLDCPVGYAPQASPLRTPSDDDPGAPRTVFVGDLGNATFHAGRAALCRALGAVVVNSHTRAGRRKVEARLPQLYRSARYCLSMSPRAPGYTSVRTYSILACGGAMLLHRFPDADRLFVDGEDAVLFDSVEDLRPRLADLDRDETERQRIADNGRRLHAQRHTVAHRVLSICRQVTGVSKDFDGWL